MRYLVLVSTICLGLTGCQQGNSADFFEGRIVDLTHTFSDETIFWPTEEGFILEDTYSGYTEDGYFYAANSFCTAEHGGTHIDAPIHFYEGRPTVDEIPLERLMGGAILVDVSGQSLNNRDYQIDVSDFADWESNHGRIPEGTIVLLKTGYGQFWPDREAYMGTAERGPDAVAELSFPGLHPEAAQWLVDNRTVNAVGLDTPSIDYGRSTLFESHQILFEHNIPAFENVANLDMLPATGFSIIALPMKIGGGSGGPLRIVAVIHG